MGTPVRIDKGSLLIFREQLQERCLGQCHPTVRFKRQSSFLVAMMTLYQMLSQAVESVDPQLMRAKIEDFEKTFEQSYGRKMTHEELSMLKTAKEIVERKLWAEKLRKKAA